MQRRQTTYNVDRKPGEYCGNTVDESSTRSVTVEFFERGLCPVVDDFGCNDDDLIFIILHETNSI